MRDTDLWEGFAYLARQNEHLWKRMGEIMASIADISAEVDQLAADVATLAGIPKAGQGQVVVAQSDLDALNQKVADLDAQVKADVAPPAA